MRRYAVMIDAFQPQLECRIVVTYGVLTRSDLKTEVGMYCPVTRRYERLGFHGPAQRDVDKMVKGLKERIEKERHLITYSVMRGPR